MRRILRIVVTVVVLAIAAVVVLELVKAQGGAEATAAVTVEDSTIIETGDLLVTVSGTGAITPAQEVGLSFQLSAPVKEILVQDGQTVAAGDVLARLDATDLETALTNAELALANQQASYDALVAPARDVDIAAAQAAVTAAQAQMGASSFGATDIDLQIAQLQADIARNQLYQQQLQRDLSGAGPDNVTQPVQLAEDQVELADVTQTGVENQPADVAALSSANAQLVQAQVRLDRLLNGPTDIELQIAETQLEIARQGVYQAEANLNRAVLVAPFDGVVADINIVIGEVPAQGAAIQLIDPASYYVDVAVDETDIVNIQNGQTVTLDLDALPDAAISGLVTRVALTPAISGQLVTYTVRVTLDSTEEIVRSGMSATATIVVNELNNVLIVPNRFVRIDRATQQAYVTIEQSEGVFADVPVVLGVRNDTQTQLVSGVEDGQRVLLLPRASFNPIEQ